MTTSAPWEVALSDAQHSLILFFLVLTGLAMFAQTIRGAFYGGGIAQQYKAAAVAGVAVTGVAFFSYVLLLVAFVGGYNDNGATWTPNSAAEWSYASRYAEWAISVPLLLIQLFTVATFSARRRTAIQSVAVVSAFLMVLAGYIGGVVIEGGRSTGALWIWGLISTFFFVIVYAVVIYTTAHSMLELSDEAKVTFRNAMVLLLITWMVYPAVFGLQGFTGAGLWTTVSQIALCIADVAAKVGFGTLLFQVARLRSQSVDKPVEAS